MPYDYDDQLFMASLAMLRLGPEDVGKLTPEMICSVYDKVLKARNRCQKRCESDVYEDEGLSIM